MLDKNPGGLAALVLEEIGANPFERDGYVWAAKPLSWYASVLKVSLKTAGEWTKSPEFDRLDIIIDGKKTPLLRLKKLGDKISITHCQRLLQRVFVEALPHFNELKAKYHEENISLHQNNLALVEKELGLCELHDPKNKKVLTAKKAEIKLIQGQIQRELKKHQKAIDDTGKTFKLNPHQYGCLRGLVIAWGVDDAPDLLRMVLQNWSEFVVATKDFIASQKEAETLYYRYFEYPTVTYIRLFNHVALELAVMKIQEKGETPRKNDPQFPQYKRFVDNRNKQLMILKERLDLGCMSASESLSPFFYNDY